MRKCLLFIDVIKNSMRPIIIKAKPFGFCLNNIFVRYFYNTLFYFIPRLIFMDL